MNQLDSRRARRRGGRCAAALRVVLAAGWALSGTPAGAAIADRDPAVRTDAEDARLSKLQTLLAELELYRGPIDGRPSAALAAALRQFLQTTSLPLGGEPTDEVFDQLEARVRMQRLTRFLSTLGREQSEQARAALLSQPATRDLVAPPSAAPTPQSAPRTGSVFACARTPSPDCLIAAAVDASQAIDEARLRDWALSEIVKAQARAGAGEAARATIRRLADARQMIVSLRDLAAIQAERQDVDSALATAGSIPDGLARVEAVLAIAARQLETGAGHDARASLALVDAGIDGLHEPLQRAALRARAATLRSRAGDSAGADAALAAAEQDARRMPSRDGRATGLGFVATALAEMGRPGDAARLIAAARIADGAPAALAAAASAAARARDPAEADRLARLIEEPRFRAVAFVQLAAIDARQAEPARAADRLAEADRVARAIGEAIWRDYPLSRIAQAYIDLKQPEPAAAAAHAVADATIRARLLFVIAHLQAAQGAPGAGGTLAAAEHAAEMIVAPLDHCWMLTEVALAFAGAGDRTAGQAMLRRATEIAVSIQEPASRARAFSRVASVMLEL
jgi:peptidoglycan hydrolase-like protein with peptidoglycan-binding domain